MNHRYVLVEALPVDVIQADAVKVDSSSIFRIVAHEQTNQGGLSRAGATHHRIFFPFLEAVIQPVENFLVLLIREAQAFHLNLPGFGNGYFFCCLYLLLSIQHGYHSGNHRLDGLVFQQLGCNLPGRIYDIIGNL